MSGDSQLMTLGEIESVVREMTLDEYFWRDVDSPDKPNVRFVHRRELTIYVELGMVGIHGRLFQMDLESVHNFGGTEEFRLLLSMALNIFGFRKLIPVGFYDAWAQRHNMCGSYVLFFGSEWRDRRSVFSNYVILRSWARGWRTCNDWVVYVQRRVRARVRAGKLLAFAMAFHPRLGARSAAASLGADAGSLVCRHLV